MSPCELLHDSISRWLSNTKYSPSDVWKISSNYIDKSKPCLLIADDTVLSKIHSKKIDLVSYQYSGNKHDVIAGIGVVNLLWYG